MATVGCISKLFSSRNATGRESRSSELADAHCMCACPKVANAISLDAVVFVQELHPRRANGATQTFLAVRLDQLAACASVSCNKP